MSETNPTTSGTDASAEADPSNDPQLQDCEETLAAADQALKQLEGDDDQEQDEDGESVASNNVTLEAEDFTNHDDEEESLESMKRRVEEMEAEAKKIEAMQTAAEQNASSHHPIVSGPEADNASIYVGNVDYSSKPEELQTFFAHCGTVQRVTILTDKWSGHPKGYAYVQFRSLEAVANAVLLDGTEFKGRQLKIAAKRTNIFGYNRGSRGGGRGRGRGYRGGYRGRGGYYRGRGRGFRGGYGYYRSRGRGRWRSGHSYYAPY